MTERFKRAYQALYDAFMNDTLAKGTCKACAVGNIVAAAQGGTIIKGKDAMEDFFKCSTDNQFWSALFCTNSGVQEKKFIEDPMFDDSWQATYLKSLTGYTVTQMAEVEFAFESNTKHAIFAYHRLSPETIMEDQFKGLMAVMDLLIKFDEVQEGETYKNNFKNKFATV